MTTTDPALIIRELSPAQRRALSNAGANGHITSLPPAWQAHHTGLHFLAAHGIQITTAVTIAGPCERCDQEPAVLRVYGDPAPDFDDQHVIGCEQVCAECGPWVVSAALQQQSVWSWRPIQVEIQAVSA